MGNAKTNTDRRNFRRFKIRLIVRFFCIFVVIYGSLTALWFSVGPVYSKFYQKGATVLFGKFGPDGTVRFCQSQNELKDIDIFFRNKELTDPVSKKVTVYVVHHSSRYNGYYITALLIALIVATPLTFKRRGLAVLLGMILIHVFIALKMLIQIIEVSIGPLCLFQLNPFFGQLQSIAEMVFVHYITPSFTVSVIIWIVVCFRRSDCIKVLNAIKEQSSNPDSR